MICTDCKATNPANFRDPGQHRCNECHRKNRAKASREFRARRAVLPERHCAHCKNLLPASKFSGGNALCRGCYNSYQNERHASNPYIKLTTLRSTARGNAIAHGKSSGTPIPFNITKEHLHRLWDEQKGRCYYTGVPLTYASDRADTAISIDRTDPEKGYVEGNVVLASWGFNRMKQNFTLDDLADKCRRFLGWYERHG